MFHILIKKKKKLNHIYLKHKVNVTQSSGGKKPLQCSIFLEKIKEYEQALSKARVEKKDTENCIQ